MSGSPEVVADPPASPGRRAVRRQETKEEIVVAAWDLVREAGLAGLAMRDLGDRVGMKAQSIYSYFGSKHEIYDAMFREGYLAFVAMVVDGDAVPGDGAPDLDAATAAARRRAQVFFDFCTSDPVRYQLLFQRPIPDFVPSAESYAVALTAYESLTRQLATFGVDDPEAVDLWTAVLTGLTDQQISNDPGGDRWERIIHRAVDMLLRETAPHLFEPRARRTSR